MQGDDTVTTTFPIARRRQRGYDRAEVDAFLERARLSYDGTHNDEEKVTSDLIRHQAFKLKLRGGYSTKHVDAALERLEDAFATRERDSDVVERGHSAVLESTQEAVAEIRGRLDRPTGERFRRTSILVRGYNREQVDAFAVHVVEFIAGRADLDVEQVRTVAFTAQRAGYAEEQVDALLDAVVDVMQDFGRAEV
jgi:DivIVA domain-containing protein